MFQRGSELSVRPRWTIRWIIARLMDRFSDTCWVSLALWAMLPGNHPFWEILELRHTAGNCEIRGEPSYCGKCRPGEIGRTI